MAEIKRGLFIVTLDRKHFLENSLESRHFPLRKRHILLQEIEVGIELNLDEVWRLDAFLNGSEVDTFRHKLLQQFPRLKRRGPNGRGAGNEDYGSSRKQGAQK
jgi:hypothetical protein